MSTSGNLIVTQPFLDGHRYQRTDIFDQFNLHTLHFGIDRNTGHKVVLKNYVSSSNRGLCQHASREASVLQELHHENVIRLLDVYCTENNMCLVYEAFTHSLKRTLAGSERSISNKELKGILYQLLDGLHHCHCHGVVHRDLKPANICFDSNGTLKIINFDLGRTYQGDQTYTQTVVTLWYRAPEILLGERHYTPAVDMWSVGCIFAELARGKVLFRGDSEIGQLFEVFQVLGTPSDVEGSWPGVSELPNFLPVFPKFEGCSLSTLLPLLEPEAIDLLGQMLRYHPGDRISAKEAMQHPWFQDM